MSEERSRLLATFLLSSIVAASIATSVATAWAGALDGSACDDAGLDRGLRRLCRTYCDARACASEETGAVAPACGRLLARYLEKSGGDQPPCDVVPRPCRDACRPRAWRAAKQCRETAAAVLEACGNGRSDPDCVAKAAADLDACLARVGKQYRACIDDCTTDDACTLPTDSGPCEALIPRWYFDAETGVCERFVWGGCGGNANNFELLENCQAACMSCDPDGGVRDTCTTENCDPTTHYCQSFTGGVPGSPTVYDCLPLPEACLPAAEADCSCLDVSSLGCTCSKNQDGAFAVDCAAP